MQAALAEVFELRRRRFARMLERFPQDLLAWEPVPMSVDEHGCVTIGRWGGYLLQISHLLINDRLVLTPEAVPIGYDHGWCYEHGQTALIAAIGWDPEREAEPAGYVKRATPGLRVAGERAAGACV